MTSHLASPLDYPLTLALGGDFRARATDTLSLPMQKVDAPVGLGFISYIGSDRWEVPPDRTSRSKLA